MICCYSTKIQNFLDKIQRFSTKIQRFSGRKSARHTSFLDNIWRNSVPSRNNMRCQWLQGSVAPEDPVFRKLGNFYARREIEEGWGCAPLSFLELSTSCLFLLGTLISVHFCPETRFPRPRPSKNSIFRPFSAQKSLFPS